MLILRININCHQVRGMCQVWDFHIEYSEFCEKDSREHILLVQLLSLAEQWLMLNWNPKTTRWLFSFKLQAGSWELLSSIKGNKYHKWLQGCHHPVLPLPNLTYLMYHFWSRLNVSYCYFIFPAVYFHTLLQILRVVCDVEMCLELWLPFSMSGKGSFAVSCGWVYPRTLFSLVQQWPFLVGGAAEGKYQVLCSGACRSKTQYSVCGVCGIPPPEILQKGASLQEWPKCLNATCDTWIVLRRLWM